MSEEYSLLRPITSDVAHDIVSNLESRGIVLSCSENKGADQLHGNCEVDSHMQKSGFPMKEGINEPRREKTSILVSDLVRHKPGCTVTEDGLRLEILDLESKGIVLSIKRKQRRCYREANLRLCFRICKMLVFP